MKDTQHSWVKHLVDWGPLAAFFIAFKVGGIMQATVVLIVVTVVLTSVGYFLTRRIQPMPLVTLVIVCIFGGLTIWLQDETFIKMKPTIILTLFAVVLIGGLTIGKPVGFLLASWLAVKLKVAEKPAAYSWRQLLGAGTLAGIGFTMSLFIAGQAFPVAGDFAAAKIAVFVASVLSAVIGMALLWNARPPEV